MRFIPTLVLALSLVLLSFLFAVMAVGALNYGSLFVAIPTMAGSASSLALALLIPFDSDLHI